MLWVEFFITGYLLPVLRLVRILDEPDLVRGRLTEWLRAQGNGFFGRRAVFARRAVPVRVEEQTIDGPLHVNLSIAVTAKAGKLKFAELPIPLSEAELVRLAAKSMAVWSLRANTARHLVIAELCEVEATRSGGAARPLLAGPKR